MRNENGYDFEEIKRQFAEAHKQARRERQNRALLGDCIRIIRHPVTIIMALYIATKL